MNFFELPNKPLQRKERKRTETIILEREEIPFVEFTDEELYLTKSVMAFDIESYPNYFLLSFRCYFTDKVVYFEKFALDNSYSKFNIQKLLWVIHNNCIVGFNSLKFDILLVWLSMQPEASVSVLKQATNFIIEENWRKEDVEKAYKFKMGEVNHIDLIEVAPLAESLKKYAARLNAQRLQELPYNPDKHLTEQEIKNVRNYNINSDLPATLLLLKELSPQLALRYDLSKRYNQDLRSKSDAQIAEAILSSEVKAMNGYWSKRPPVEVGRTFKYNIPDFIKYKTQQLQQMYEVVKNVDFVVRDTGNVVLPEEISKLNIKIGGCVYTMGIGGLHSTESCVSHIADENTLLIDRDVASFYPQIILNLNLYPKHLGENFNIVYRSIVERRLHAKRSKDKVAADSLKIVINGGFGKLGSQYSILYSPDLMIAVTLTGQLSLLMLIEMIELVGIPIISGNTDGIVIKCPKSAYDQLNFIISMWEKATGFETEETRYKAIYARDVNNYFAIKEKGDKEAKFLDERLGIKVKGCYAERGSALNSVLSKNPETLICSDAVLELLSNNVPVEQTIYNCKDLRRFLTVRNVKGGGEKDGIYLGKIVRYYYAKGVSGTINYVMNGKKVPNSENAKPCMDLLLDFPQDIDYDRYIEETRKILYEINYLKSDKQEKFF